MRNASVTPRLKAPHNLRVDPLPQTRRQVCEDRNDACPRTGLNMEVAEVRHEGIDLDASRLGQSPGFG